MRRPSPETKAVAVAGLSAGAATTAGIAVLHTLVPAIAFPPNSIAQILVRTTSGGFNSVFIGLLGHWAQRLAVLGTAATFALAGAVLALVSARLARRGSTRAWPWLLLLLPLWAASVVLYPEVPQYAPRLVFAVVTLPLYLIGGTCGYLLHRRLTQPLQEPAPGAPAAVQIRVPLVTRRYLLVSLGVAGAGITLGLTNIRELFSDLSPRLLKADRITRATRPSPSPGDATFETIDGLTPELTSTAKHYVVDEEIIDPILDPQTWRLSIGGLVGSPFEVTYSELKQMPLIERYQTLECVSNEVGGDLISTAKWVGVPLKMLLERAGIEPGAVEVVCRASGGYSDSLPLEHAMDESTLVAIGMNDHELPREHGFPARLLSLGTYGYKNPKWLTSIEVFDRPYRGFWQKRGWNKEGFVKTMSRIDVPRRGQVQDAPVDIAGIAFAADRGISRVEVSVDRGRSWTEARLKTPLSGSTWKLWLYRWEQPREGATEIMVRAYDGTGAVQISKTASPFPSGASGYHQVEV